MEEFLGELQIFITLAEGSGRIVAEGLILDEIAEGQQVSEKIVEGQVLDEIVVLDEIAERQQISEKRVAEVQVLDEIHVHLKKKKKSE